MGISSISRPTVCSELLDDPRADPLGVLDGLEVDEAVAEVAVKPWVPAAMRRVARHGAREVLRDRMDPSCSLIGRTAKS
jgi:hypothetical protein